MCNPNQAFIVEVKGMNAIEISTIEDVLCPDCFKWRIQWLSAVVEKNYKILERKNFFQETWKEDGFPPKTAEHIIRRRAKKMQEKIRNVLSDQDIWTEETGSEDEGWEEIFPG